MRNSRPSPLMKRLVITIAMLTVGACTLIPFQIDQKASAPTLDGFGENSLWPSQANDAARLLFAQGMGQVYGFNGAEAIRAFKAALARDPECGLCAWGVAYEMGPNINNPRRGDLTEALRYVEYALKHSQKASERDRALIESLALRYAHGSVARDVAPLLGEICAVAGSGGSERANPLDVAYAERMQQLADRFPNDPDVLAIYAEAEMVATTADWWDRKTGQAGGKIGDLANRLEANLIKFPNHTGLNHYMIHSVDAVQVASRAVAAADRLGQLAPKSPHLLHMPSHTYAQVGRYADATRVNQLAVAADETMMVELKKQNFSVSSDWRGHNRHFQWYGALMEGRGELALETARAAAQQSKGDHTFGEYTRSLPMLTLLYLQRWDVLQKEAMPTGGKGVATVLGEMSRGIAFARTGQIDAAKTALTRLEPAATELLKKNMGNDYFSKLIRSITKTAQYQLRAELALAENRTDDAISYQAQAADAAYDAEGTEPPILAGGPLRRLGQMQVQTKAYAAAEQSFKKDLIEHPHSGWSLQGLNAALLGQGKKNEAQLVKNDLDSSWKSADSQLRSNY
ncbi:hypothetical protein [Undibacterium flavidum]|uniref:Tetratricopeptide repeat protein n=1 Tax=Undibacterium flavidum TaxID=2762297 RepID=A0ABR6YCY4_9BURK|nr:hypothetical protein [Undibacterium flavidum]MBC3874393.1 hypothetical protein [Undibacterium flavidum]